MIMVLRMKVEGEKGLIFVWVPQYCQENRINNNREVNLQMSRLVFKL